MKSRAALKIEHGKPVVVDDIELPDPSPHQVIVKQFATGICHSQLHQLHNPKLPTPMLLGHESTGVVVAKGTEVTHVNEGDHVLMTWLVRNMHPGLERRDPPKVKFRGQELAARAPSCTWSDYVIEDESYVVRMDNDVATDVTAIIGCAVMTGCGAVLNIAKPHVNDSIAVYGVGGLGLCVVQACANSGAYPIIAIDLTEEKLAFAKQFGATHGINASKEDPVAKVREMTNGGTDFAFDVIGVTKTMEQVMPTVRPGIWGYDEGGTAVLVGQPTTQPAIPIFELFSGSRTFRGCAGGTGHPDRDFPLYVRWFREGKLPLDKLVTRRYKLEQVNEACAALERGEIAGRAIFEL